MDLRLNCLLLLLGFSLGCGRAPKETPPEITPRQLPVTTARQTESPIISDVSEVKSIAPASRKKKSNSYRFSPEPAVNFPEPSEPQAAHQGTAEVVSNKQEIAITSLQDLYRQLEKPGQTFTFSAENDTVLIGAEGTQIAIPAGAFVSEATGKAVSGPVRLELKEYYTLADIFMANLSTTSGKDLLETGGMLYLEAYAGNEKLKLQPGKQINLGFPTTDFKPGMQLFNGEWKNGKIDWVLAAPRIQEEVMSRSEIEIARIVFADNAPEFPGGPMALRLFIDQNLKYPYSAIERKKDGRAVYSFVVNPNGNISDLQVLKSVDSLFDKAAFQVFSKMPKWTPCEVKGQPVPCRATIPVYFRAKRKPLTTQEVLAAKEAEKEQQNVKLKNPGVLVLVTDSVYQANLNFKDIKRSTLSYYSFQTSDLNWINCDRSIFNENSNSKIDFAVLIPKQENVTMSLVFHKYKALLGGNSQGKKYFFDKVPDKEKVTLVAVKVMDGNLFSAIKETNISRTPEQELIYKPTTLKEFQTEIKKLNSL